MSSDHQPPSSSSSSAMPRPFRFWLPYRSNLTLSPASSSRPQPPPPTRAEPPPPVRAAVEEEEDIPIQASDEPATTIPVQALDSLQLRGARAAMADLELTLSRPPPPPTSSQQQDRGSDGNDGTKISISGFPRARLFDGARAPYRREIEDGLKSLADRATLAPPPRPPPDSRVITLAGHNVGASMVLGNGSPYPAAVATNVNSNVQSVNNSTMEGSTCNAGDPGVHVDIENARRDPVGVPPPLSKEEEEKQLRAPTPPGVNTTAASGGEAVVAKTPPPRIRRCLRALMLETKKPKPIACRFQCAADHVPPPAMASDGSKRAEESAGGARGEAEA